MNLHSKICIYTSVCGSPFEILKRQIFRNRGSNFDVSRQLAARREALLRLLPRQRVRGGSQHEEKLLLTSGGRAAVHLVSDCQKYYCSTIIIVRLPEEEKSQAQGHLLTKYSTTIAKAAPPF